MTTAPRAARFDCTPINFKLMKLPTGEVLKYREGRSFHVVDQCRKVAIVEKISERHAAAGMFFAERGSRLLRDVGESPVAQVVIRNFWLSVTGVFVFSIHLGVDMAVGDENPRPSAVVKIVELHTPTQPSRYRPESGGIGNIVKHVSPAIEIERRRVIAEICFHDSLMTGVEIVSGRYTHSCLDSTVLVVCDSGSLGQLRKCAVVIVVVKQTGSGIAGYVDVRPSIVIKV